MSKTHKDKQILSELFNSALNAVNGRIAVEQQLLHKPIEGNVAIIAVGKAAAAMMLGAKKQLNEQIQSALIITKVGHADNTLSWPCIESGHPIPNLKSLEAGAKLLEFISNIPKETKLLALISGGASALVEVLPENMDLELLVRINKWLLGSGLAIEEINRIRQAISLIKGGKALNYLGQNSMTQFLISDVKGDDPEIIGSGLFVAREQNNSFSDITKLPDWLQKYIQPPGQPNAQVSVESHIIASNDMACQSIIEHAKQANYEVNYHGQALYGDVFELAESLVKELINAKPGLHIWGGETTLVLPDKPGRGGRNQSLALALACAIEGVDGITVLVGATDGSDGPTDDAGAIIDGLTIQRGQSGSSRRAKDYLAAADAGTFLADAGDLLSTGPTGTNVMDIVIAIKESI
jgi:hydroxypyruvate reductase